MTEDIDSNVTELRRLSHELETIGTRAGNLGRTSETLNLLARTTVLMTKSLSSLAEKVRRLECPEAHATHSRGG